MGLLGLGSIGLKYVDIDSEGDHWNKWHGLGLLPGDLIHAPHTFAVRVCDFAAYQAGDKDVKIMTMGHKLLLLIAIIDNIEFGNQSDYVGYMVMSRHGPLICLQSPKTIEVT